MASPVLEFNYDISCPFAYIASTRVEALAQRTSATLIWRPVLLGAIYRATSAPQGAAGSASDVYNPTKKAVTARSMQRTLKRYQIEFNQPPQHSRKSVNALRLLHYVGQEQRPKLSKALFRAYWVEGRDVADSKVLLQIVRECGISGIDESVFRYARARKFLEEATAEAIERGAFGVPGFWIPQAKWADANGEEHVGRFYWGQDRMHFVEGTLLAIKNGGQWKDVEGLRSLLPRCIGSNKPPAKTRVEFWYDFSSPWAYLGYTQLQRLQRTFGPDLEVVMKPFLLGILFREIGAPNLPMAAVSAQKAAWSRQDHADWVSFWNAVNEQEGRPDKPINFHWASIFPIRTPTVLRCAMADPNCVPALYRACWEQDANVSDDNVLSSVLTAAGFNGPELLKRANAPAIKTQLREATAEAKAVGICGVPSYRVFRQTETGEWKNLGGIVWGQDQMDVVEDLIAGWDDERSDLNLKAEPRKVQFGKMGARL
ncbi:thioredoxin-like protein [Westerdykella ornata]|uniref:Thioredoxin-like protein n=1 Tax=Westerdykella ornata TaxID=318751 RepID=A0A6A6JAK7_WESOR|nr:thioredoxin-like protein [Westerdykella ornata]KAF2272229.1 thioredoxin-like protein [Westerdykella ornata]